jgi:hypothetical protein
VRLQQHGPDYRDIVVDTRTSYFGESGFESRPFSGFPAIFAGRCWDTSFPRPPRFIIQNHIAKQIVKLWFCFNCEISGFHSGEYDTAPVVS